MSYSPWDEKESDMTEPLKISFTLCRSKKQGTWKIFPGGSGCGRKIECHGLHMPACSVTQLCATLAIPWSAAHQAPLSMGFPRQEYWSGFPCPSLGDLPDPGIEPAFTA